MQKLFAFIDWVMRLPEEIEKGFWQELRAYEEAKQMPYMTSVERIGIEKGIEQGIEHGILQGARKAVLKVLEARFKEVPAAIEEKVNTIEDAATLDTLLEQAVKIESLEAFSKSLLH